MSDVTSIAPADVRLWVSLDVHKLSIVAATLPPLPSGTPTRARKSAGSFASVTKTWGVFDPDGRFDASNDGNCEKLHWVLGNETLPLRQFRDRAYDPGLLAKHLGFHKELPRKLK